MKTAKDLKPGDRFVLLPRSRKIRQVSHVWDTNDPTKFANGVPEECKGKLILILRGCGQLTVDPEQPVNILENQLSKL